MPDLARFYCGVCNDIRSIGRWLQNSDCAQAFTLDHLRDDVPRIADDVGADDFHYAA